MKKHIGNFIMRGVVGGFFGPIVLAVIYGILGHSGVIVTMTPHEVALGILTVSLLAFLAAGITAIYQIEQLPLPIAILLHAAVLYVDHLGIYLLNGWLHRSLVPILIFTACFIAGFAVIWLIVYAVNKRNTKRINKQVASTDFQEEE